MDIGVFGAGHDEEGLASKVFDHRVIDGVVFGRAFEAFAINSAEGFDEIGDSTLGQWVARLEIIFESMAGVNPAYIQIRYINDAGEEVARVNSDGNKIEIHTNYLNKT